MRKIARIGAGVAMMAALLTECPAAASAPDSVTPLAQERSVATVEEKGAEDELAGMMARADRFFHYKEWVSSGALYTVLASRKPDGTEFYGRGIVASGMLADTAQQQALTEMAIAAHVPIDSLFASVERNSFSIGQTSLYERYLLDCKATTPWLTRIVDACLMRYYAYRRDAEGMIAYSGIMLRGNPTNESFLYTLAQGYLLSGQMGKAMDTYLNIVQLNPGAYEALLYLANFHYGEAGSDKIAAALALAYFEQASTIRLTPYVEAKIASLRAITQ